MIGIKIRKIVSLSLIAGLLFSGGAVTAFAEDYGTGAEPGMEITSEGVALGLYGNRKYEDAKDYDSGSKSSVHVDPVSALVQKYSRAEGSFILSQTSRFFIAGSSRPDNQLLSTVRLMNAEFAAAGVPTETPIPVVYASEKRSRSGDIVIKIVSQEELADSLETADVNQQYNMEIGDKVVISAASPAGVNYGLITLLEMCLNEAKSERRVELQACHISDGPDAKERTIFLDCGRKYFSPEYIKNLIRRSAMQRYNAIELHFSDAEGLRLESSVFPWLTDGEKSLTRDEMVEIIELARTYNMEVIPSIDVPGHNQYIVQKYAKHVKKNPDFSFSYQGRTYDSSIDGFGSIANHYSYKGKVKKADYIGIDITRDHAVAFMDALIDDYAGFFLSLGCDKFNLGGDEVFGWYNFRLGDKDFDYSNRWESVQHWQKFARKKLGIKKGSASDTFIYYINHIDERLAASGITTRVFSDEINLNKNQHIKLNSDIEVLYWYTGTGNFTSLTDENHTLYNDMEYWVYYVVRQQDGQDIMTNKYKSVNPSNIYNNWNPQQVQTKSGKNRTIPDSLYGGGYFNIWCDTPDYKSAGRIWKDTEMLTWANGTKLWNSSISTKHSGAGAPLGYSSFKSFAKRMGSFPGFGGNCNGKVELPEPAKLESASGMFDMIKGMLGMD